MKNSNPFFSIIIPTFNRASFLKSTIQILLCQTFRNFEILVADNSSNEESCILVKKIRNPKVKYYRTGINIGLTENLQRIISHAKGTYIMFLGDDDFLLFDTCLDDLYEKIIQLKIGFIRLNLIDEPLNSRTLQKKLLNISENFNLLSNQIPVKIIHFLDTVVVGMLTGLVLKNSVWVKQKLLKTENAAWFPLVYETVKHYGGCFVSDIYIVIRWSVPDMNQQYEAYKVRKSVLDLEPLLKYIVRKVKRTEKGSVTRFVLSKYIYNIPSIKLYTDNRNCIRFVFRIFELEHSFVYNPRLWMLFLCSIILPKQALVVIRSLQHKAIDTFHDVVNYEKIYQRYEYLKKKYY